jgi:Txe/YoeB family toxin of Txe-Axe toxin-antitoxin module
MEKDETLEDMCNRITPENMHPETEDDMREWSDLENDYAVKDLSKELSDEEYQKKIRELIEQIKKEPLEFRYSAEELRNRAWGNFPTNDDQNIEE